jgi:hypothetical protein
MDQVRNLVLGAVLLCGCSNYDIFDVFDIPDERIEHTLAEWQQQGLPVGECVEEVSDLVLTIVPESSIETDEYCGSRNAGMNVLGCFYYDGSQPTVVMRSQMLPNREGPLEHELRHWLAMCSGHDPSGDPEHDDTPIWYETQLYDGWNYSIRKFATMP